MGLKENITYSYSRSSQSRSLSWVPMIIVAEIENCSIIPQKRANKSEQKACKKGRKRRRCDHQRLCKLKYRKYERVNQYKTTHENHPIPQPKHGSGMSNFPNCWSSESLIGTYSPLLWSILSKPSPNILKQHICIQKQEGLK